jgi:hypothetical protein
MLTPILSGLVAGLVVYLLSKTVRSDPQSRENRYWVEYGPGYKILAGVFFPLSAFVTYAALQASPDQTMLALVIAGCFWLGTLYLAYEFFFVHLSYDDEFIYHQTPLRRARKIPWRAVKHMRYSPLTQAFSLITDGYGRVTISPMADGSRALIERVSGQTHTDIE